MQLHSYIKSYLDIPVVLGVGISRARSMSHTYLSHQVYQGQSPEKIKDRIRYVLSGLPDSYEFFEQDILDYHLYVFRIDEQHSFVTLLLHENNVVRSFRAPQLIRKISEELEDSKRLFQELATHQTLSGVPLAQCSGKAEIQTNDVTAQKDKELQEVTIQDVLEALNGLSRFSRKYIGPKIVSNYWQLSRPKHPWLELFEIKFSAAIRFSGDKKMTLSPFQILVLREWTQNFMRQCHTIIQDLPQRFEAENMPEKSRKILSIYTSEYLNAQKNLDMNQSESLFADFF